MTNTSSHPTFAEIARDLVRFQPPKDDKVRARLDEVRAIFTDAIDALAGHVPDGPDATLAARKIHDACQACIFAIVHNQDGT